MSRASILSLAAVVITVLAGAIYLIQGSKILPEQGMSDHGWIALALGVGFSVVVGGALTAVLVIGRRRGFDEAAHDVSRQIDPGVTERDD